MTNKMLKFTDLSKETPFKEDSKTRISNFNEIYKEFIILMINLMLSIY